MAFSAVLWVNVLLSMVFLLLSVSRRSVHQAVSDTEHYTDLEVGMSIDVTGWPWSAKKEKSEAPQGLLGFVGLPWI